MSTGEFARRVEAFHRRSLAIVGLESLAVAASAGLMVLAAALLDGADLGDRALTLVAIAAGAFGGAAFFGERRPSPRASVRRLDRGLAANGAVETAWEHRAPGSSIAELLMRRAVALTARSLPTRAPSPAFLGGPLVALALVLLADSESVNTPAARSGLATMGAGVSSSVAGDSSETPDLDSGAAVVEARLTRARQVLKRLAVAADPDERARAEAEWAALEGGLAPEEKARLEPQKMAPDPASGAGGRDAAWSESSGSGADGWSGRGSAGMMSGRSAVAESGAAAPFDGVTMPEPVASSSPTRPFGWIGTEPWPVEYEELVERWLDQRAR